MIVYKDKITGDEMFTDSYPMKEVDGCIFEVPCKLTSESQDVDEKLLGSNPSAEEAAEAMESAAKSGLDIVLANRLVETGFDHKAYGVYIKAHLKAIKAHMLKDGSTEEEIAAFQKSVTPHVQNYMKKLKKDPECYQFFTGESMNPDGGLCIVEYLENGMEGIARFLKHGLIAEKF